MAESGGGKSAAVANLPLANDQDAASEPLAELGIAPGATLSNAASQPRK